MYFELKSIYILIHYRKRGSCSNLLDGVNDPVIIQPVVNLMGPNSHLKPKMPTPSLLSRLPMVDKMHFAGPFRCSVVSFPLVPLQKPPTIRKYLKVIM